jgi:hypothetical protein
MAISFEEARLIALSRIGSECALIETETLEKPYGWYFMYQSREYLETGNHEKMLVGSGGFIVEREDGRVFEFGSAFPIETWLANYEKGFKYDFYDLTILSVADPAATVDSLARLSMQYVVPEFERGTLWKIPREFTRKQLVDRLSRLPCVFQNQAFWHRVEELEQMKRSGCCKYELRGHDASDGPPGELIE